MCADRSIVGKIYSVACKNFVTYDNVIMYPGEHLNVILGPNGTGKSTMISAIILGMGGKPKVISRSADIEGYVKRGKETAWIQVKLYKNNARETISFEKSFDLKGKCHYRIDNMDVSQKTYIEKVSTFNIQVENLCQFLPQDRVQDFAKMNAQEILTSTLSSVCDPDMTEKFDKLKILRSQQLNQAKTLKENAAKLKDAEQRVENLKERIEQMNIRSRYVNDIEICVKKKAWIECNEINKEVNKVKKDLKNAKTLVQRDQNYYDEQKRRAESIHKFIEKTEQEINHDKNKTRQQSAEYDKLMGKNENLEQTILLAKGDFEIKKQEEHDRDAEIASATALLQAATQDFRNAQNTYGCDKTLKLQIFELTTKANEISIEIKKLLNRRRNINTELDENYEPELQAINRQIFSIENIKERRLNNIRSRWEDVYKGVIWLQQNRHLFEGHIYEPMILELNVINSDNAKYFENTVSMRDLLAFTCVNRNDVGILIRKLCNEQGLRINVLHSEEASHCRYKANDPIDNYREYGFHSYLIDLIEGPPPILNYLCKAYSIHRILVGSDKANQYTDNLPNHINLCFTPTFRYQISFSRYSGGKTSIRVEISSRNLLCFNTDSQKLNTLREESKRITKQKDALKNERTQIDANISIYEQQKNDIVIEKKQLEGKRNKLIQYGEIVRTQKAKVEQLNNTKIDLKEEEIKLKNFAMKIISELLNNHRKLINCLAIYQECLATEEYKNTKLQIFKQQHLDLVTTEQSRLEALNKSKKIVANALQQYEEINGKYKKKLREAMDMCEGKKFGAQNFPYTQKFSEIPDEIEALSEHIEELQARLDCMTDNNPGDVEDYESGKQMIETLKEAINSTNQNQKKLQKEISEIHKLWHPKVLNIVEAINRNFSKFMSSMNYAGELQLATNGEYDYDSYGIRILVKYRNDANLQVLDRFVQSGGERTVAIAVYSLSLQHLTSVPFRCVDEINQGMDPINERKIFELLVDETDGMDLPQYFFVTPKLLPNLKYNENMSVHIVFNGKFIANNQVFNEL